MQEQVFINCVPEDLPFVVEIKKRVELADLSFYVPPASLDPVTQKGLVEKIKSIAASQGCMLCILSNRAVSNSFFISNIQLMCETARTGRVLVTYQVEPLENDQNIRLFASQAYQVQWSGDSAVDTSRIIQRIQQVLHPPSRNLFQFLSRYISRKVLIRLSSTALLLGVVGAILFNVLQPAPAAPVLPTPTPVVLYVPFSGQSQDIGLTLDVRSVPEYIPDTEPALEAPFSFQPGYILEQDDFSDPTFEHNYDKQKWFFSDLLNDVSSMGVNQANGVLQLAVAPIGNKGLSLVLNSRYLFNLQQVTYLGYRFRLDSYQGMIKENTSFHGHFFNKPTDASFLDTIEFDGLSQDLLSGNSRIALGSRWHTVEMISQVDRHLVGVYLDGKKIQTLSFDDDQLIRWMNYDFALDISNTTDWVRIQIDEIVYGADQPIAQTLLPENAPYRFVPDKVDLHEDFSAQTYQEEMVSGAGFVTQSKGVLSFSVPPGMDAQFIRFQFPTRPINENNYYATRFRFTNPDDDYWVSYACLFLGLDKKDPISSCGFELSIGTYRPDYFFMGNFGPNQTISEYAHNQNAQPGNWHTLEMIIKPPAGDSQGYTVFFWVDGYLLGEGALQDPAMYLDINGPVVAALQISSGSYRTDVFSGEIDDLVIGFIASEKIEE
jgi:hypothetical protein